MAQPNTNQNKNAFSSVEMAPPKSGSTQAFLDIDQIREGVVIAKDGGMKVVLMCSAINFDLKSELEKNSIIYGFQSFLNSLDFPVQIVMQSRRLDMDRYLKTLEDRLPEEKNELLNMQIQEYVAFVRDLIQGANIMQKRFYVVIPHYPSGVKQIGNLSKAITGNPGNISVKDFNGEKKYLMQKVEIAASGLQAIGIGAFQLVTQDLIELYYGVYNPDQATSQRLVDASQLEAEIIEKLPDMEIG